MRAKTLYSMEICLTVQGVWHVKHCGRCCFFSIKEWVNFVWRIRNQDIGTFSLDFLKAGLHSPKVKKILWMLLFKRCGLLARKNLLILVFKSVYGILNLSDARPKSDLAAESALLFPHTPIWLGFVGFGWLFHFNGIWNFVAYLMSNLFLYK